MRIRPATDADLDAVLDLWRRGTPVVSHTDDGRGLRTLLARDPEALLVAEDDGDGRLVGTLIATWDGWRAGSAPW
jgi:ribosomal protein S18 acetylase RimI-like enzyme